MRTERTYNAWCDASAVPAGECFYILEDEGPFIKIRNPDNVCLRSDIVWACDLTNGDIIRVKPTEKVLAVMSKVTVGRFIKY